MRVCRRGLAAAALVLASIRAAAGETPVWPQPPAQARIEFVQAFSRPSDLGIARGLLGRVADFLFGAADERLVRPMAVALAAGVVYVADPGARGVHRFDRGAGRYALIAAEGGAMPSPVGLAAGGDGEVYVVDSRLAQVFLLRPGASVAVPLRLDRRLTQPTGIAVDAASGRLYVVDAGAHCVYIFSRDGSSAGSIGRRGDGDGEFNFPTHIWRTAQGLLYVTDALNFRVQSFDAQGRFRAKFGRQGDKAGDAGRQKGVASDRDGRVYVVDALFHALQIFADDGRPLLLLGERGHGPGEFWLPTGICIDERTIYVADAYNQRVQVFRSVGGPS